MGSEKIKASNFAKSAAYKIYNRLEDDIGSLKSLYTHSINIPNNTAEKYSKNKLVYDSRDCNNFTAYARDFTVAQIYQDIMQALKSNGVIDGEDEYLYGNSLVAAVDLMVKYMQRYVKGFSTRPPNSGKQTKVNILCRDPNDDADVASGISQNVSSDVQLDYDFGDIRGNSLNMIQKIPIQGLFGTLAREIDRQRRFFIRYSIYQK